jgi:hypothetical protein
MPVPVMPPQPPVAQNPDTGETVHDYTHLLAKGYPENGFSLKLRVKPKTKSITATIRNGRTVVGQTHFNWAVGTGPDRGQVILEPWHTEVEDKWRGRGLGAAMYDATLLHAKGALGVTHLQNKEHSTAAMHLYRSLSKKYKLGYKPQPNVGGETYPTTDDWLYTPSHDNDGKWQGTKLELSEQPLSKMAVIHDDPNKPFMVWRMQNKEGLGPYSSKSGKFGAKPAMSYWAPPRPSDNEYYDPSSVPHPENDFSRRDYADFVKLYPQAKFGFHSKEALENWFNNEGGFFAARLGAEGFRPTQVPASKVWRSRSGKQVFYIPHGTTLKTELPQSGIMDEDGQFS